VPVFNKRQGYFRGENDRFACKKREKNEKFIGYYFPVKTLDFLSLLCDI
jgi:hypothetical protein